MRDRWVRWGSKPFWLALLGCLQFVLLTAVAMWVYPGGSAANPRSLGYSFFGNFFSDLGLTVTRTGHSNWPSLILFVTALTIAGLGLIVFFVAAPQFFWRTCPRRVTSLLGSFFGILSGLSFVGIAWSPANVERLWHIRFVMWAFEGFLVAAAFYVLAMFLNPAYPRRLMAVYLAFTVLLGAYVYLLTAGPGTGNPRGLAIQIAAQKVIVYAAIVATTLQAWGALALQDRGLGA